MAISEFHGLIRMGIKKRRSDVTLLFLFIPGGVEAIVTCYLFVYLYGLGGVDGLDELGGDAGVDAAGFDDGVAEHDGTGGYYGAFADNGIVEDNGAHADQGAVADFCAVEDDIMPDGYVVADFDYGFFVQGVEDGAVLDVDAVADADGIDVAAEYGSEPDAAAFADDDVADDDGGFGKVGVLPDDGGKASYCFY